MYQEFVRLYKVFKKEKPKKNPNKVLMKKTKNTIMY